MLEIQQSKSADTRSAEGIVTKDTLITSTQQHIQDVGKALGWMCEHLKQRSVEHDRTKLSHMDDFYQDFTAARTNKYINFCNLPWYKLHISEERHHLDKCIPENINMFDILERIADIVMAGMARTGNVFPDELPPEALAAAYKNTIALLKSEIVVKQSEGE